VSFAETHTTIFPHFAYPVSYHWRSVCYAAQFYKRTPRQIKNWCTNGTFAEANIPVYQDKSKRWWVCIPQENL
jgi:hypothetical protein